MVRHTWIACFKLFIATFYLKMEGKKVQVLGLTVH